MKITENPGLRFYSGSLPNSGAPIIVATSYREQSREYKRTGATS